MILILDLLTMKRMLEIAVDIMAEKFYYDKDALHAFLDAMEERTLVRVEFLDRILSDRLRTLLHCKPSIKQRFTIEVISAEMIDTLTKDFYFSEVEVNAFLDLITPERARKVSQNF